MTCTQPVTRFILVPPGRPVHIVNVETREYPESQLIDLYDIGRLVDSLDNIHFYQRPLVARDLTEPNETRHQPPATRRWWQPPKHVGSSWVLPEHLEQSMPMLHMIAGGEKKWRERPFVSMSSCFVVPPLRFAEDACKVLEVGVRAGMPVLLPCRGSSRGD